MNSKKSFIDLGSPRNFLLAITSYTLVCMLIGNTTITWNTVSSNFELLVVVVLISLFFNKGK